MKKILSPICFVLPAITFLVFAFNEATLFGQPGGGPNAPDKKILKDFDADKDGVLNKEERAKARESLKANARGGLRGLFGGPPSRGPGDRGKGGDRGPDARRGKGGPGGGGPGGGGPGGFGRGGFRGGPPGGRGGRRPAGTEGPKVSPSEVKNYPNQKLYDTTILRTIFLDFESDDWEAELTDFKPTDVEVPATVTVDGKKYPNVGVSFRGASSFFSIPSGSKRSLNLSMDYLDDKQKLYGYKTLNLLNCNGDASLMSSYLYAKIAGAKIATPKVNFVKVVINGRSWGVYANVQQFNKDFLKEFFDTKKGARWKVSGSPRGDAGLRYIGEDIKDYRAKYEIKSKDKDESWKSLINLCKVLNETPTEDLEAALEPILDIDGALWFLACDVALINSDGYWTRASDYSIYLDPKGKFHILPHDMNESFRASRSRGFGGLGGLFGGSPNRNSGRGRNAEPQGGQRRREESGTQKRERPERNTPPDQDRRQANTVRGYDLDPMTGLSSRFPLRQKLLAVPSLKKKYLQFLKEIASKHIAWKHLGTEVKRAAQLIESEVEKDTRKLATFEDFQNSVSESDPPKSRSLQEFSVQRSKFLLDYPAIKELENTNQGAK